MRNAYVFLATGFEEMEALGTVDVLRRTGIDVTTVSISDSREVVGSHGVPVIADKLISEVVNNRVEWLILPGGMPGATNLHKCPELQSMLNIQAGCGGKIGAICASPGVVLGQLGLLNGKKATCYPGFESLCKGAEMKDERCVVDGNIITANGPSSVINFAFAIASDILGREAAVKVMNDMLVYPKEQPYFF